MKHLTVQFNTGVGKPCSQSLSLSECSLNESESTGRGAHERTSLSRERQKKGMRGRKYIRPLACPVKNKFGDVDFLTDAGNYV